MISLREFAINKKRLENRLMDKSEQLTLHLFKIFYHGSTQGRIDHWSGDLYDILNFIPSLKGSHIFPSKKDIYYNLWGYIEDRFSALSDSRITTLNRMAKGGKEGFGVIKDKTPNYDCKKFCEGYFDWLSERLSMEGEVSEEEIREAVKRCLTSVQR